MNRPATKLEPLASVLPLPNDRLRAAHPVNLDVSRYPDALFAVRQPGGAAAESLRAVRAQLMLRWIDQTPDRRVLAIVGTMPGEGRTSVCANLAVLFAQLGETVLAVDANLRRPRLHELFALSNTEGLADALSRPIGTPAPVHRIPDFGELDVLTAGAAPSRPQELLTGPGYAALLDDLARRYSLVLVDTPSSNEHPETQAVAVRAGACLLVARRHKTRLNDVQALATGLGHLGARVVGIMLNQD